jgi:hypothetical protein
MRVLLSHPWQQTLPAEICSRAIRVFSLHSQHTYNISIRILQADCIHKPENLLELRPFSQFVLAIKVERYGDSSSLAYQRIYSQESKVMRSRFPFSNYQNLHYE